MMEKVLIVQTTFSDNNEAVEFSKTILKSRLAACVQLSSEVQSMYWWKKEIEKDMEIIVTMKTLQSAYPQLEALIEQTHSYETPEIMAVAVEHVSRGYYQWLNDEIGKDEVENE
jgi:periplasmic divalent cation tolerance protein